MFRHWSPLRVHVTSVNRPGRCSAPALSHPALPPRVKTTPASHEAAPREPVLTLLRKATALENEASTSVPRCRTSPANQPSEPRSHAPLPSPPAQGSSCDDEQLPAPAGDGATEAPIARAQRWTTPGCHCGRG